MDKSQRPAQMTTEGLGVVVIEEVLLIAPVTRCRVLSRCAEGQVVPTRRRSAEGEVEYDSEDNLKATNSIKMQLLISVASRHTDYYYTGARSRL